MFRPSPTLNQILSTLANPSLLTHLEITLLSPSAGSPLLGIDTLLPFTTLTHLTISGAIFPSSTEFYEMLHQFPLKFLQIGPNFDVDIDALSKLLSDRTKPTRIKLDQLILSNLDAQVPEDGEDADLEEWVVPEWPENRTKEGVEKLRIIAQGLGIETSGTTLLSVDIEDSEAYQAALERAEEEESGEESEEDEEEDYYGGYESHDSEDSDYHEEEHEERCGCHRTYDYCWRYADMHGWPRRYGRKC